MRTRFPVLVAFGLAALCGVALSARDAPPARYVQAMKDIQAAVQTLNQFSQSQDFKAAGEAGKSAREAFLYVQEFWNDRKATDAADLAAAAAKAAGDVGVSAGLNSGEGVQFAAKELGETCMACHANHRVRKDDGTFALK